MAQWPNVCLKTTDVFFFRISTGRASVVANDLNLPHQQPSSSEIRKSLWNRKAPCLWVALALPKYAKCPWILVILLFSDFTTIQTLFSQPVIHIPVLSPSPAPFLSADPVIIPKSSFPSLLRIIQAAPGPCIPDTHEGGSQDRPKSKTAQWRGPP